MTAETVAAAPAYSRTNPFPAKLLVNRLLSGPESAKDTRHFELDLTGWGGAAARLQHHAANTEVLEGDRPPGQRCADAALSSRP